MSLFGLHRRLRGAIVGHLAAVRDDLVASPTAATRRGCGGSGFDAAARPAFFDEHVEADAVHENIAAVDLAGGLARVEPALRADILWGARALRRASRRGWARHLLESWEAGRSSLRAPLPAPAPA